MREERGVRNDPSYLAWETRSAVRSSERRLVLGCGGWEGGLTKREVKERDNQERGK